LNQELDYADGILFSEEHGVVVTGSLTDDLPATAQVQSFSDANDPWYYLYAKEKTRRSTEPVIKYIPLAEYLF
jgi:Delta24-sterol reductase